MIPSTPDASKQRCVASSVFPGEEFLSIARVAQETNMSEPFWRKVVLQKRIAYVKIGSSVRIRRSVLERYLADREVGR